MKICLIQVPYDLGRENIGMGNAPQRYLQAGVEQRLKERGFEVRTSGVRRGTPFQDTLSSVAAVNKLLAQEVGQAIEQDEFPLILGGSCNVCLGALSGFDHSQSGIIWFDAHGDFNTPETTISGYFDGMPLAIATGHCYQDLWAQISADDPVADVRTLIVGARDLDPKERALLEGTEVQIAAEEEMRQEGNTTIFTDRLDKLAARVRDIYLHLDIDVLDPQEAPAVNFPTPQGLSGEAVEQALRLIGDRFHIKAASLTAYNPERDQEGKTLQVGLRLINALAESASR